MNTGLVPFTVSRGLALVSLARPALFLPSEKSAERFFGFFTANIPQQKHAAGLLQSRLPVFGLVRGQGTARPGPGEAASRRGLYRNAGPAGAARAGAFQTFGEAASGGAAHVV